MKFGLIDRIIEIEPAKSIIAVKAVSLSEEYLAEHFPTFPVLPGVFMLECMVEAASWLVRASQGFDHSVVLLESAKGVTYKSFVAPGELLRVEVKCLHMAPQDSRFKASGFRNDTEVVKGRFSLTHFNLSTRSKTLAANDELIQTEIRRRWSLIRPDKNTIVAAT
jgi:3-hydroxyacyl-[acyl-carrier-protein] dehydratase